MCDGLEKAVSETREGTRIAVSARPRGRETEIQGVYGDSLKIAVAAPPVDGKANAELVRFFSGFFGIPKAAVHIAVGAAGRHKVVICEGITKASALAKLAAVLR